MPFNAVSALPLNCQDDWGQLMVPVWHIWPRRCSFSTDVWSSAYLLGCLICH